MGNRGWGCCLLSFKKTAKFQYRLIYTNILLRNPQDIALKRNPVGSNGDKYMYLCIDGFLW